MIRVYDSVMTMRADAVRTDACSNRDHGGASWYGGESPADTLRLTETGDQRLVSQAQELLDKLDTAIEVPRKAWERAPVGVYCAVPDVLAGLPTPMRRMVEQRDDRAPINIISVITSSGGLSAQVMLKRGVAILALAMALARVRPITLSVVSILDGKDNGETVVCARVNTAPLDLASACYVLTSAGFCRRLTYGLMMKINGARGSWPNKFRYGSADAGGYYTYLANMLSPDPAKTLVIGASQLNDPLISAPIQWINDQVARFTTAQELAAD
jgi:hypothetical protein